MEKGKKRGERKTKKRQVKQPVKAASRTSHKKTNPKKVLVKGKKIIHHNKKETKKFVKGFLTRALIAVTLFIATVIIKKTYFEGTTLYYRNFRMSEIYFSSFESKLMSSLTYLALFIVISAAIYVLVKKMLNYKLVKQIKSESTISGFATL